MNLQIQTRRNSIRNAIQYKRTGNKYKRKTKEIKLLYKNGKQNNKRWSAKKSLRTNYHNCNETKGRIVNTETTGIINPT